MNFDLTYSFMLPMLMWFYQQFHSYGWAIVMLTLVVRILCAPLVQAQTVQMRKMSQLQPEMQKLQARYKDQPEILQKKLMEFYGKNKMNPAGGCLPLLVQFPILIALFATFTGPPFADKPIDVKVHVVAQADAAKAHHDATSSATLPYVSNGGQVCKLAVFPGESTVVQGEKINFGTNVVAGQLEGQLPVLWKTLPKDTKDAGKIPGVVEPTYTADFPNTGDYVVQATVPGVAQGHSFFFMSSLGKVARGVELLNPKNWDLLGLIVAFGITTWLSSLLSMGQQTKVPDSEMTEQQLIQKQTMKIMPVTMTIMFFFIPLPAGVFLYMVISNVFQTAQTWVIMQQPVPGIISVVDEGDDKGGGGGGNIKPGKTPTGGGSGVPKGSKSAAAGGSGVTIASGSAPKAGAPTAGNSGGATINVADDGDSSTAKPKTKKKKK